MSDEHRAATSGANVEARDVFGSVFAANISRLTSEQQALFTDLFRQMLSEQRPGGIVNVAMGGATATTMIEAPYIPPDASAMMEVIRQSFQTFYAKPWGLPDKNEAFAGRQTELAQLKAGLLREGTACISTREEGTKTFTSETTQDRTAAAQESTAAGESKRKAILGPGGFGKTQLAIACAYELANEYHFVIYFHGSRELLSRDIRRLARETGFGFRDDTPVESIAKSLYWLLDHLPRVLFIVDDVERLSEVKGLLPPKDNPHFHCLYTSRRQDIWKRHFKSGFERILLGVFTPEESIDYFDKAASPELKSQNAEAENHVQWRILSEKLGHLPLALSQAMAYLNEHCKKADAIARYIKDFERNFSRFASCSPDDIYQHTILTTWMITLPKLLKRRAWLAVEIFFALAYLQGGDVPVALVESYCAEREGLPEAMKDEGHIENQIDHLKRYSLITVLDGHRIQVHQMVQRAIAWWLSEDNDVQREIATSSYTGESAGESDEDSGGEDEFRTCTVDTSKKETTFSYPRQIDAIARHIERAKKKGCVTEPYQLICTVGSGLYHHRHQAFNVSGHVFGTPGEPIMSQAHVLLANFLRYCSTQTQASDGAIGAERKLMIVFFAALYVLIHRYDASQAINFHGVIDRIIRGKHLKYYPCAYGSIALLLDKISPSNIMPRKQAKDVLSWLEVLFTTPEYRRFIIDSQLLLSLLPVMLHILSSLRVMAHTDNIEQCREAAKKIAEYMCATENPVYGLPAIVSPGPDSFSLLQEALEVAKEAAMMHMSLRSKVVLLLQGMEINDFEQVFQYISREIGATPIGIRCSFIFNRSIKLSIRNTSPLGEQKLRFLYLTSCLLKEGVFWKQAVNLVQGANERFSSSVQNLVPTGSSLAQRGLDGIFEGTMNINPDMLRGTGLGGDLSRAYEAITSCLLRMSKPNASADEFVRSLRVWFGEDFNVYFQCDSRTKDVSLIQKAAELALCVGFYDVSCHYTQRRLVLQKNVEESVDAAGSVEVTASSREHLKELALKHADTYSHLAFQYLVLGRADKAETLFTVLLSDLVFYEACHAIYYVCYLISQGEAEAAFLWFEKALRQEDFPITFNHWCMPHHVPHALQAYLQKTKEAEMVARTGRGLEPSNEAPPHDAHFSCLVLSSHQLVLLWMLEFACEQSEPQNETNRKQRCYELMQRLSKLPLATSVKERLDFFYDYKSQLLLRQHLWQKIVLPITGFLPPEIVSQNRPSATVTGKEDLQLNRLLLTYKLSDTSSNTLEKGLRNAAVNNRVADVKAFLSLGVTVNAQDTRRQRTALHWAVLRGHAAVVETLLAAGGRYDIPDSEGETARMMARREGNESIIAQLEADEMLEQGLALLEENIAQNYSAVEETEVIRPVPAPVNPGVYTSSPASLNTSNPTTDAVQDNRVHHIHM